MAHIEKQRGKYRARFADPLGKVNSRTFARKADAERFLREVDADRVRGHRWSTADVVPLADRVDG